MQRGRPLMGSGGFGLGGSRRRGKGRQGGRGAFQEIGAPPSWSQEANPPPPRGEEPGRLQARSLMLGIEFSQLEVKAPVQRSRASSWRREFGPRDMELQAGGRSASLEEGAPAWSYRTLGWRKERQRGAMGLRVGGRSAS